MLKSLGSGLTFKSYFYFFKNLCGSEPPPVILVVSL